MKSIKKHVVMVISNSPNPSYFRPFAEYANNDSKIKLSFVFLDTKEPIISEKLETLNAKCYTLPFNQKKKKVFQYFRLTLQLIKLFIQIKPDVVQTNLFDDSLPGLLAARICGVKNRIITKQDTNFHILYFPQYIKFDKFNNFNATTIVPCSGEVMELINKYETKKTDKIKIIHHGMDENYITNSKPELISEFSKKYNLSGKIVIGIISRYVEIKGYKGIIEAANIICKQNKNVVFIGIGDGHQKNELQEQINKYELQENFILTGKIQYDLIPASYKNMDIFLHNSINEAFGFVFPEAMFNKVPIVSTNVGAVRDVLTHKENCYKTKTNNPEDIADGINYILSSNRNEIAEKAYKICKNNFTIEKMWIGYRELFLLEN